ncbi:18004_t:CDS:2, partial [Entrophospora sp. SA101]
WSAVMPWGICQRTCCSRKSKAKLSKKFAPKGVPLMPSTLDNDVDNLMKFLGLILLRSTNFSIKNDEENTSNSDNYSTSTKKDERDEKDEKDNISNAETSLQSTKKDDDDTSNAGISSPLPTKKDGENTSNAGKFLIKIKNKIKRENSVGQKVNMSNLQPSNSKNGKHDQTLDEQDGNPILTDKLPIDKDQFEDSPSGPEKEKLADKIIRKFSRKGKKSTNDPSNIKNDEDDDKIEVLQDKNGSVDVPEINPNQSDSSNNNSPGANPSEIELLQTLVNIVQDGDGNVIDVTKSSRSSMISPDELRKSTVFEDENASTIDVPETSRSGRSSIFTKDEDDNLINPDDVTRSISIVADENGNIINVPEANKSSRSSIIVKDEDGNVINLDDINPDDIRRGISIVEDENGNVINVPETNSSSRSSIIIKDEDGNVINLDDINPDDIRRSVAIVKDENGNIINVPGKVSIETLSVSASTKAGSVKQPPTNWLKTGVITKYKHIGTKQTTAQLHPYKFTMTLMEEAESRGAKVIIGRVDGIEFDMAKASGVKISTTNEIIAADTVVVAMGPWSGEVLSWLVKKGNRAFQLPDVSGQRAHSIVLKPSVPISAHVCFVSLNLGHRFAEPEIYPRPDGEVYISGECDESTLPESADGYIPNPVAIRNLKNNVNTVSPDVLGCAPVIKEQCCYMPITDDDKPLIGKIPWLDGVYIATGHSVWGILNSSGTGKVIAEMILEGQAKFADVRALAPMRPKK